MVEKLFFSFLPTFFPTPSILGSSQFPHPHLTLLNTTTFHLTRNLTIPFILLSRELVCRKFLQRAFQGGLFGGTPFRHFRCVGGWGGCSGCNRSGGRLFLLRGFLLGCKYADLVNHIINRVNRLLRLLGNFIRNGLPSTVLWSILEYLIRYIWSYRLLVPLGNCSRAFVNSLTSASVHLTDEEGADSDWAVAERVFAASNKSLASFTVLSIL